MAESSTTMEKVLAVLLIISIILSGGTLYYVTTIISTVQQSSAQLSESVSQSVGELSSSIETLSGTMSDVKDTLSSVETTLDRTSGVVDNIAEIVGAPVPTPPPTPPPPGPATIKGVVTEAVTGVPIKGADVLAGGYYTKTKSDGSYIIKVPTGVYEVTVMAYGYQDKTITVEATEEKTYTVNFELELEVPKTVTYTLVAAHWFIYEMGPDPSFAGGANPAFLPLMYDTLFAYDPESLRNGEFKVIPWVAESYTVSDDGLTYTIKIRKGIKFHNTGNELTADDVIYTINRRYFWPQDPGYPLELIPAVDIPSIIFPVIDSVEKVNDYEIKLHTKYFFPAVLEWLCWPDWGIMDSEELEKHAIIGSESGLSDHGYTWLREATADVGSGPYMLKHFKMLERYELVRNPDYWGGPPELHLHLPRIETIVILAITEDADARLRMLRGELDIASDLLPDTLAALWEEPGIKADLSPGNTYQGLWFHCFRGALKDWRVRKAIKMALDYKSYAEDIMLDMVTVCQGGFLPGMPGWEENAEYFPGAQYDEANALLDEAGYPVDPETGWRFTMELMVRPVPRYGCNYIDLAAAIKDTLANIGINVEVTVYEVGEYYARIMDMSAMEEFAWIQPGHYPILTDPGFPWTYTHREINWFGWNSTSQGADIYEQSLALWDAAAEEQDPELRIEKFQEYDRYMLEYGPQVTLFANQFRTAYSDKITNFFVSPLNLWPAIFYMDKTIE